MTALCKLDNIRKIKLHSSTRRLLHYMQGTIPCIGCFTGQLKFRNRFAPIEFFVISSGQSLLGTDVVTDLKFVLFDADLDCYVDALASCPDMLLTTSATVVASTSPSSGTHRYTVVTPSLWSSDNMSTLTSTSPASRGRPSTKISHYMLKSSTKTACPTS